MASNESSRLAVNFNVKLSTGNYETEDFSLSIEQAVDPTLTRPELMVEAEELGRSFPKAFPGLLVVRRPKHHRRLVQRSLSPRPPHLLPVGEER